MNKIAKSGVLVLAWISGGAVVPATTPKATEYADYDRPVDAAVARYHLSGIAAGVVEDGKVSYLRQGNRYLVHWDQDDAEAWPRFRSSTGDVRHMAKVDPDTDFSYDYEDLAFQRVDNGP